MHPRGSQGREKTNKHNFLIALLSARCRYTAVFFKSLVLTCWVCLMKRNSSEIIHHVSGAILKMSPNQREGYQMKWGINRSFTLFYVLERKRFCRKIDQVKYGQKIWRLKLKAPIRGRQLKYSNRRMWTWLFIDLTKTMYVSESFKYQLQVQTFTNFRWTVLKNKENKQQQQQQNQKKTTTDEQIRKMKSKKTTASMHSSRMHTVRLLTVSRSIWGGGSLPRGVSVQERGCLLSQGGGVYPSMPWGRHPSLPVDRMTDRCKNITLPKLRLRAVIT